MYFRFSPFDKPLSEINGVDLATLRGASEGWYIEYKSQLTSARSFAKSLSAFANQYGGWLFVGIEEDPQTLTAKSFPGVPKDEASLILETIRNASKDLLNPEVYYEVRVFTGPIDEIDLPSGRDVVIVMIPPGPDSPYVHADGRIYRRVADSSDPKPETDRSTLDRLWDRAETSRAKLKAFVTRRPITSKGEENSCYLHVSILSDPYELRGDWYAGGYSAFVDTMRGNPIPFDNFFTRSRGYIARQISGNDPYHRLFTWDFDLHCHSFVTLPITFLSSPYVVGLDGYSNGSLFAELLEKSRIQNSRLLDLNMVFEALIAIANRHRTLVATAGIRGPFFVKASLENVWRTVPFLDMASWIQHCSKHGVPVVQDENALAPPGIDLSTFAVFPEQDISTADLTFFYEDAIHIGIPIFQALGIPDEFFVETVKELFEVATRFRQNQKMRNAKSGK